MRLYKLLLDKNLGIGYLRFAMANNNGHNQLSDHGDDLPLADMGRYLLDVKKGIRYLKQFLALKEPEYEVKPLDEVYEDILAAGHAAGKNKKER